MRGNATLRPCNALATLARGVIYWYLRVRAHNLCAVDARYNVRLSGVGSDVLTIGTY